MKREELLELFKGKDIEGIEDIVGKIVDMNGKEINKKQKTIDDTIEKYKDYDDLKSKVNTYEQGQMNDQEKLAQALKEAQETKAPTDLRTPVIVTLDKVKEKKFDDPYLNTLTSESQEYIELMQAEVKRNGNRIIWDAENEALFMKIYTQCGIDEAADKFEVSRASAPSIAFRLRKKYPDFKKLKSGKAAASYAK